MFLCRFLLLLFFALGLHRIAEKLRAFQDLRIDSQGTQFCIISPPLVPMSFITPNWWAPCLRLRRFCKEILHAGTLLFSGTRGCMPYTNDLSPRSSVFHLVCRSVHCHGRVRVNATIEVSYFVSSKAAHDGTVCRGAKSALLRSLNVLLLNLYPTGLAYPFGHAVLLPWPLLALAVSIPTLSVCIFDVCTLLSCASCEVACFIICLRPCRH